MNAYLEKHPNAKHLFESLSFNPQQTNLDVNRITGLIDELSEMTLQGGLDDNLRLFSNMFSKYQELDMDKYQNAIDNAIKNDKFGFTDKKKLEEKDCLNRLNILNVEKII